MADKTSKSATTVRDYSRITFRKDFARSELDSAINFTSAPLSELVQAERCRIKVVRELIYQMETCLIQLRDRIPRQSSSVRALFRKGHSLVYSTRAIMRKVRIRQDQVPNTCSCECRVQPASVTANFDELAYEFEVDCDSDELPYCID